MKSYSFSIFSTLLLFTASLAFAEGEYRLNQDCQSIKCLTFSDEVLAEGAIFLLEGMMTAPLQEAVLQVRETDSSYAQKTDDEVVIDILTNSSGRSPGW